MRQPPSTASAVLRFAAGSLAAITVVMIGSYFVLRDVTIDEAECDTRRRVQIEGRLVEAAGLTTACCAATAVRCSGSTTSSPARS